MKVHPQAEQPWLLDHQQLPLDQQLSLDHEQLPHVQIPVESLYVHKIIIHIRGDTHARTPSHYTYTRTQTHTQVPLFPNLFVLDLVMVTMDQDCQCCLLMTHLSPCQ